MHTPFADTIEKKRNKEGCSVVESFFPSPLVSKLSAAKSVTLSGVRSSVAKRFVSARHNHT